MHTNQFNRTNTSAFQSKSVQFNVGLFASTLLQSSNHQPSFALNGSNSPISAGSRCQSKPKPTQLYHLNGIMFLPPSLHCIALQTHFLPFQTTPLHYNTLQSNPSNSAISCHYLHVLPVLQPPHHHVLTYSYTNLPRLPRSHAAACPSTYACLHSCPRAATCQCAHVSRKPRSPRPHAPSHPFKVVSIP